jgi:hypothetical protein
LEQLSAWATKNRLNGPRQWYEYLRQEADATLASQMLRFPQSTRLAQFLYRVNLLISPRPITYELGRTAHYRSLKSR